MRTFVGDDEFVQPKRNETAPRSECRFTFKNALTQPVLHRPVETSPVIGKFKVEVSQMYGPPSDCKGKVGG
jgi:hypothetical protein